MKLKEKVNASGVKKSLIAEKIGVTPTTMSSYLAGRSDMSIRQARILCELLGCTIDDIEW